jgi:hypothetical protein
VSSPRTIFVPLLIAAALHSVTGGQPGINIEWDPHDSAEDAAAVWLGYLVARTAYHEKHNLPMPVSGEILPTFGEEVAARTDATTIYQELKAKDKKLKDAYWEELIRVKEKGFMPEYVWTYLRRRNWHEREAPKNLAAFENWRGSALRGHKPQTHGRISASSK